MVESDISQPHHHQRQQHYISINGDHPHLDGELSEQLSSFPNQNDEDATTERLSNIPSSDSVLQAILDSIDTMQSHFFEVWAGTWPSAIDWTAAVMGTQISATLAVISRFRKIQSVSEHSSDSSQSMQDLDLENLINRYFTQITSFYFGENAFTLRMQAYDDMLWVVLGWLEGIKFINLHSDLYHKIPDQEETRAGQKRSSWYGRQFIPQFAHRARVFYDMASDGWDTSLCGGGMIWSPYFTPYKNAITNQLFIAASISMYLYFPGDENPSPFHMDGQARPLGGLPPAKAHDPEYLEAAIDAYRWLSASNMTNDQGLYVDGFHIHGWRGGKNSSTGSGKCDVRNEMVYTYNQGVLLSGLRGLWEATRACVYLEDGHQLIQNVITATGWYDRGTENHGRWAGIGRNGVLEEACDSSGTCNQNGQTFKGIFFHHLATFCAALSPEEFRHYVSNRRSHSAQGAVTMHETNCKKYVAWVKYNADAAYVTRNERREFGTWWGDHWHQADTNGHERYDILLEGTDYRNTGLPNDQIWQLPNDNDGGVHAAEPTPTSHEAWGNGRCTACAKRDPNDRGRGRTVETQSGGLAVLRARWQLENS